MWDSRAATHRLLCSAHGGYSAAHIRSNLLHAWQLPAHTANRKYNTQKFRCLIDDECSMRQSLVHRTCSTRQGGAVRACLFVCMCRRLTWRGRFSAWQCAPHWSGARSSVSPQRQQSSGSSHVTHTVTHTHTSIHAHTEKGQGGHTGIPGYFVGTSMQ